MSTTWSSFNKMVGSPHQLLTASTIFVSDKFSRRSGLGLDFEVKSVSTIS